MNPIASRYEAVMRRVADSADVAGRDPAEVTVVGVTKTVGIPGIRDAFSAGLRDFGENRVQEFLGKYGLFPEARWHFIGTLQSNKVKDVVGRAHLIHSVDSVRLLESIARKASEAGVVQPVLLQVNVSGEAAKHGFPPGDVEDAVRASAGMGSVEVRGLMTMAPFSPRPQDSRATFRECAALFASLNAMRLNGVGLTELSMGMTGDFEVAVEEGATIVRVGRAIFGAR